VPKVRSTREHDNGVTVRVHHFENPDGRGPYGLAFSDLRNVPFDETFSSIEHAKAEADPIVPSSTSTAFRTGCAWPRLSVCRNTRPTGSNSKSRSICLDRALVGLGLDRLDDEAFVVEQLCETMRRVVDGTLPPGMRELLCALSHVRSGLPAVRPDSYCVVQPLGP
jgi:hypothetical protein